MNTIKFIGIRLETPFGKLPVLLVDGVPIAQSHAIGRYVAREFNLYGSNNLEHARVDQVIDYVTELIEPSTEFLFKEQDKTKIKEKKDKYFVELVPSLEKLEAFLGDKDYFLGDKISYADICFFAGFEYIALKGEGYPEVAEALSKVPNLKKLYDRVANNAAISESIKARSPKPF